MAPGQHHSVARLMIASLIGLSGALADISMGGFPLIAAPQFLAAAIGRRLPRRLFVGLIGFLSLTIILPAFFIPLDRTLIQRGVGLLMLSAIAYV